MANRKLINLALQGGGAHGAFTWGVLDAILEDGRLKIEALSGTSAGAMNAAAFAEGYTRGGEDGARACLRRFWEGVASSGRATENPFQAFLAATPFADAMRAWRDVFNNASSPYDLNPFNINPLRDLVADLVDFERVRACDQIGVFIAATNVETGRTTVFKREELTADHVMASACLPTLYQAVEIDGVPYWDGGYVGNPPLFPFFYQADSRDIVVVQINPVERKGKPRSAAEIADRVREITFNSSLLREYRSIAFVKRLLAEGRVDSDRYKDVLIHRIDGGGALFELGASSRLDVNMAYFEELFERGRSTAHEWLHAHYEDVGERSTLDLSKVLDNPHIGV